MPDLKNGPLHEVFVSNEYVYMEQGLSSEQAGSFAVEQAALARAMSTYDARTGVKLLDVIQTTVVLGWYYVSRFPLVFKGFCLLNMLVFVAPVRQCSVRDHTRCHVLTLTTTLVDGSMYTTLFSSSSTH